MKQPTPPPHGFTFLEMILMVSVFALLAGVAMNKTGGGLDFGKAIHAKADIQSLSNALRIYKSQNGFYPTTAQGLRALIIRPLTPPLPGQWHCLIDDPTIPRDPWDNAYHYTCPGKRHSNSFDLTSYGPDGLPNTADDIENTVD
jgi:general secretion pathway protein G